VGEEAIARTELLGRPLERVAANIAEGHPGARMVKRPGDTEADAGASAGDEDDVAGEVEGGGGIYPEVSGRLAARALEESPLT
jgi:hypothetical protein